MPQAERLAPGPFSFKLPLEEVPDTPGIMTPQSTGPTLFDHQESHDWSLWEGYNLGWNDGYAKCKNDAEGTINSIQNCITTLENEIRWEQGIRDVAEAQAHASDLARQAVDAANAQLQAAAQAPPLPLPAAPAPAPTPATTPIPHACKGSAAKLDDFSSKDFDCFWRLVQLYVADFQDQFMKDKHIITFVLSHCKFGAADLWAQGFMQEQYDATTMQLGVTKEAVNMSQHVGRIQSLLLCHVLQARH